MFLLLSHRKEKKYSLCVLQVDVLFHIHWPLKNVHVYCFCYGALDGCGNHKGLATYLSVYVFFP